MRGRQGHLWHLECTRKGTNDAASCCINCDTREGGGGRRNIIFRKMNGNIYIQNGNVAVLRFSSFSTTKSVLGFCWLYLEQGMALWWWKRAQREAAIILTIHVYFNIKILSNFSDFWKILLNLVYFNKVIDNLPFHIKSSLFHYT